MALEVMLSTLCPTEVVSSRTELEVPRPKGVQLAIFAENAMALPADKVPGTTTSCAPAQVPLAQVVALVQATLGNSFKPPPTAMNPEQVEAADASTERQTTALPVAAVVPMVCAVPASVFPVSVAPDKSTTSVLALPLGPAVAGPKQESAVTAGDTAATTSTPNPARWTSNCVVINAAATWPSIEVLVRV